MLIASFSAFDPNRSFAEPKSCIATSPNLILANAVCCPRRPWLGQQMHFDIRRREFITLLGGAATWPLTARAQQPDRVRRIGVLLPAAADDPVFQARLAAFHQGLALMGWTIGRNVRIDTRWATSNAADIRRHAAELVALTPDVILAHAAPSVGPLLQVTRTVPIVFPVVADPVAAGYVASLSRPGGNATGFGAYEYSLGGKWLELLTQIAPGVTRIAVIRDASLTSGTGQFAAVQSAASAYRV